MDKKIIACLLLTVFFVQAFQFVAWVLKDNSLPAWDQSWHLMMSLNWYNRFFVSGNPSTEEVERSYPIFNYANNFYPPLFHITTTPFYLLLGRSFDSAILINLPYFAILILSSYYIGKKIHDVEAGLLTAFIVSTIPVYNFLMRDYLIDYALSSIIALGFMLLLYSDHFRNLKYSLLFGVVSGLGLLLKWTFVVYLTIPTFLSLIFFLKCEVYEARRISNIKNIILCFLIALLIAASWYTISQLKIVLPLLLYQSALKSAPQYTSLGGLTYYLHVSLSDYSFFYCALFFVGLLFFVITPGKRHYLILLLLNILGVYLLLTVTSNKDFRYLAPLYVFLSPIAATGFLLLSNRKIRYALLVLVVIISLFQNLALNSTKINLSYKFNDISIFDTRGRYPRNSEMNIDDILSAINNSNNGIPFTSCVIAESGELNDVNIPYYSLKGNYPVEYVLGNGCNPMAFDYIILGPIHGTWRGGLFLRSRKILEANTEQFELIHTIKDIKVYKKKNPRY